MLRCVSKFEALISSFNRTKTCLTQNIKLVPKTRLAQNVRLVPKSFVTQNMKHVSKTCLTQNIRLVAETCVTENTKMVQSSCPTQNVRWSPKPNTFIYEFLQNGKPAVIFGWSYLVRRVFYLKLASIMSVMI